MNKEYNPYDWGEYEDNGSICLECRKPGYVVVKWRPPEGTDPRMKKVKCAHCEAVSYISPPVRSNGHRPVRNPALL